VGLPALPHVDRLARRLREGSIILPAMEALARRLSLIVSEVVVGENLARTLPEPVGFLRALQGHPLMPEDFAALVIRAAKSLPEDAGALNLRSVRDEDFTGIRMALTLDERGPQGPSPAGRGGQVYSLRGKLGSETVLLSRGSSAARLEDEGYREMIRAMERAFADEPGRPLVINIELRRE